MEQQQLMSTNEVPRQAFIKKQIDACLPEFLENAIVIEQQPVLKSPWLDYRAVPTSVPAEK